MKFHLLLLLLIVIPLSTAAEIHGTIYDLSLNKVSDVVVELSSTPAQRFVSKDGAYAFSASPGTYIISAKQVIGGSVVASVEENITIVDDSNFLFDLFLFPDLSGDELMFDQSYIPVDDPYPVIKRNKFPWFYFLFVVIAFALLLLAIFLRLRLKNSVGNKTLAAKGANPFPSIDSDRDSILSIIKRERRTTQKYIRGSLPVLSEVKISLVLTELEDQGLIKKIKKGRGNIIIYQEKKEK